MLQPLKILTLNVSDSSGGAARAAYRIHKSIQILGLDANMLVKSKALDDRSILQLSDFESLSLFSKPIHFIVNKLKNKLQHYQWGKYPNRNDVFMSDLRSVSFRGALQKIDFDILHLHWINLRFFDLHELQKLNKPIVWTLHDCWPFTGICHYFYDCDRYKNGCGSCPHLQSSNDNDLSAKVWKKKSKYYSGLNLHIVSPSSWLASAARESSLFNKFPVTVIPNPINTEFYSPGSRQDACDDLDISSEMKYILYGAMNSVRDKNKGYYQLCEALLYFEQNYNVNHLEVLIFGSEDQPEVGLSMLSIRFLGMLNDNKLVSAYRAADVTIVPSLSENLSNIIMESLSCGTPVVAFDVGGNSDLIEHKENGYLAEKLNESSLAEGLSNCIVNYEKYSSTARKKVLNNFNSNAVAIKYVEVYNDLLSKDIYL